MKWALLGQFLLSSVQRRLKLIPRFPILTEGIVFVGTRAGTATPDFFGPLPPKVEGNDGDKKITGIGGVAQLVEQRTFNPLVLGSSPSAFIKPL